MIRIILVVFFIGLFIHLGANKVKEGLTDMELFENVTNLLHTYDAPVRASNDELSGIMLSNPENKLFKTNYVRNDMNNIL
tara:strand:+ start:670 stop:909 length:240 start_codon:yes stop_codon:yes gene_type:complete